MITIIDGAKGTGKTKKIIDKANAALDTNKGDTVFLATTNRYRAEIKPQIKFIDMEETGISGKDSLIGFIKGMLSANYDIEEIYIDGSYKVMKVNIDSAEMAELFLFLDGIKGVNFTLTISCDRAALPAFVAKYVK